MGGIAYPPSRSISYDPLVYLKISFSLDKMPIMGIITGTLYIIIMVGIFYCDHEEVDEYLIV